MTEAEIDERIEAIIADLKPPVKLAMEVIPHYAEATKAALRVGYCAGQQDAFESFISKLEALERVNV